MPWARSAFERSWTLTPEVSRIVPTIASWVNIDMTRSQMRTTISLQLHGSYFVEQGVWPNNLPYQEPQLPLPFKLLNKGIAPQVSATNSCYLGWYSFGSSRLCPPGGSIGHILQKGQPVTESNGARQYCCVVDVRVLIISTGSRTRQQRCDPRRSHHFQGGRRVGERIWSPQIPP